ncbi:MAG TPA: hypothetical protein DIC51_00495 [Coxiellaceae bacterium]|nr:hypothetical protein [Coxiellaceae bacterium]
MYFLVEKIGRFFVRRAEEAQYQFLFVAIIILDFLFIIYLLSNPITLPYHINITLRSLAIAILIPPVFGRFWQKNTQLIKPFYWYFCLLYIVPFSSAYFLLFNQEASVWQAISLISVMVMLLLMDPISAFILTLFGWLLAFGVFALTAPSVAWLSSVMLRTILINLMVFIFFSFFLYRREKFLSLYNLSLLQQEKLQTMSHIAASLAHELRTPLRTISLGATSINACLPSLIKTYHQAKDNNFDIPFINPSALQSLPLVLENIDAEVESSFVFINMLLVNVDQSKIFSAHTEICSIMHCINEAIRRYPFNKKEREIIEIRQSKDFNFKGDELLVIHCLFNLIKNALYHTKSSSQKIQIWLDEDEKSNNLHFKDMGKGIAPDVLPYIFNRFYSKTRHGSGIGLSFCSLVMRSLDGKIVCHSQLGEFAEFILSFPKEFSQANTGWGRFIQKNLNVLGSYPSI